MENSGSIPRRHQLARWLLGAALGAGLLGAGAVGAAAVSPDSLSSDYVTDSVDVLDAAQEQAANDRLAAAYDATGLDLYVVFVDEFTDPSDRVAWADETAELNGLGSSQYLLAISTEGRQYYVSAPSDGSLSGSALDRIEERVLPELRDEDWAGAVTVAAEQLETEQAAPGKNTTVAVGVGAGVLVLGGAAFGVTRAARNRRSKQAEEHDLHELERASGSALVAADDAVKASAQELEFARAQFGDAAVTTFATATETARKQLLEAFALRQQLDDATPDSVEQRREWLQRIIELCAAADATLDEQKDSFERLRAIEQNAPSALAAVTARREQATAQSELNSADLSRLSSSYASDELATLSGAPQQAQSLLTFAAERESLATTALSSTPPDTGAAAVAIREAEAAVAQAETLQQSIAAHGSELAGIEARCAELIAELEADIAGAAALQDGDGTIAAAIAATQQQIAQARADLSGPQKRPSRAVQALDAANTNIDGVVQTAQETARARQALTTQLAQAAEQVRQAETFIDTRRGAVGATARTRVTEARAALGRAEATQASDPQGALVEVRRANQLASDALSAAQSDVNGFGYGGQAGYGQAPESDLSAILGGIFGSGGGSGYGGSGGGFWGGGSRSSGSSWGGGSSRRSGGSSRRSGGSSRRSSGGRSGRSGGGRF
ncbi:TPM domain-containing protein [Leucobacter sp. NPDC058333]|uniref:TPM domain-containing protein n=1 Tax=Leucobacter sp. NPDC058333 TaxID=3346450 RepID=UPI00365F8C54